MPEETKKFRYRLSKAAKEFNISTKAIREFLAIKGFQVDSSPNAKLTVEMYELLVKEFQGQRVVKEVAKKLGNLSYKGGNVSVESVINSETGTAIGRGKETANIIPEKKSKKRKTVYKDVERKEEIKEQGIEKKERRKEFVNTMVEHNVQFSELEFGKGIISISYKEKRYVYRDSKITDYDNIVEQIFSSLSLEISKKVISTSLIKVIINTEAGTFIFKDIDIHEYVNRLKFIFLPRNTMVESSNGMLSKNKKKSRLERIKEEEYKIEKETRISLNKLYFETNVISLKIGSTEFILWEKGISKYLDSEKKKNPIFNNVSTKILLDYTNHSFRFLDPSVLSNLKNLSARLNNERKGEKKQPKVEQRVIFSELKFGPGFVYINKKKKKRYFYRDLNINGYDKIIEQLNYRLPNVKKKAITTFVFKVVIDMEAGTFTFKDIDICKYINHLKESFLTDKKEETHIEIPSKNKDVPQKPLPTLKSMMLEAGNIRFFNGYYLIFQTNNGEVDNSVTPFRVDDPNSQEILNLVHKFFEQKLEQKRIIVKIDETKIIEPSKLDLFKLSDYARELKRNLEVKGVWWDEVQNYRKPSLAQCRNIPTDVVKKKVSLKSGYLDILCSMQNEEKLNRVYEVNHGKEEEAFIFTISMANNRYAVIFENASNDASTTTWFFVTKRENYEPCVNLVFDYFTDYTIVKKRSTLRDKTVNPPEKFKAENYTFIDHDDLGQWLKRLNKILEQTPQPSKIVFVPGLHIPQSSETRSGHGDTITTKHLHNQLMRKLYDRLCIEHGKDNVGTENHVGTKRIDAVVKCDDHYDIYEIKTATDPIDCVKEALGQLFIYSYLNCSDNIGKMVIVGSTEATKEFEQHLSTIRKNHSLQLYYMKV